MPPNDRSPARRAGSANTHGTTSCPPGQVQRTGSASSTFTTATTDSKSRARACPPSVFAAERPLSPAGAARHGVGLKNTSSGELFARGRTEHFYADIHTPSIPVRLPYFTDPVTGSTLGIKIPPHADYPRADARRSPETCRAGCVRRPLVRYGIVPSGVFRVRPVHRIFARSRSPRRNRPAPLCRKVSTVPDGYGSSTGRANRPERGSAGVAEEQTMTLIE